MAVALINTRALHELSVGLVEFSVFLVISCVNCLGSIVYEHRLNRFTVLGSRVSEHVGDFNTLHIGEQNEHQEQEET